MRYRILCFISCAILNICLVNSTAYKFVSGPIPLWLTEETSQFEKDLMYAFTDLKAIAYSYFIDQDITSCHTATTASQPATTTSQPATTTEKNLIQNSEGHLTLKNKKEMLDLHNLYRSNVTPPASNMEYVVWDEDIAHTAQLWADNCTYKHFMLTDDIYGQNLYQSNFGRPEYGVELWNDERWDYTYSSRICKPGTQCGHYEQMVVAEVSRIGCAGKQCGAYLNVACHYDEPLYREKIPYKTGIPCTLCQHKGSKCYMNLCISPELCTAKPDICEQAVCKLKCHNCGKLDMEKCECQCADGWEGIDCAIPCVDKDERCGPVLSTESCFNSRFEFHMSRNCRKMCKYCIGADPTSNDLCCDGKMCDKGFVLNNECECEVYPPA